MNSTQSPPTRVVVATHGHCFDGLSSAVMFTRLLRHVMPGANLEFKYAGAGYGPGQNGVDPAVLSGDINAILDFRFSASPALTWYFDHHVSAFPSAGDRERYESFAAMTDRKFFHDGAYTSCTKLIADLGASRFDLDPAPTADLVRWADMIDSAGFPNATMAVERKEPVLKLMTVVEQGGDDAFLAKFVPRLLSEPIEAVANASDVLEMYTPLGKSHEAFVETVRHRCIESGGVVLVDLTDRLIEVAGKFVTYALFPESAYSVMVSRSKSKCKISIGYNPWSKIPRRHNVAEICERHGGGGHPVVGAITLVADKVQEAKILAVQIAEELRK